MKINAHIIRGYDIRGVAGEDLSDEIAEHLGRAYGTHVQRVYGTKTAVVGRDSRATSEAYAAALIRGLVSTGIDVIDIGLVLVGTVYWAQYHFNTKGAIMVTASHNPKEYNGFKCAKDFSETMLKPELDQLRDLAEKEAYIAAAKPGTVTRIDVRETYYDDLLKRVPITKKFKVVVDGCNGTAGVIVPDLLRQAGCEVVENLCNLDSTFPAGVADPTETAVAERLSRKVVETGADIGFAYDVDGDRIGIVDEKGGIIWNDVLVALFAISVLKRFPGEYIMYNTLCSKTVEDTIRRHGGKPFMWRVGHGFLKKKNQEVKAPFIGELSGHFFFTRDFYNHDDGCYATLRVLDHLASSGRPLSEEVASLPQYISSPEIKLHTDDDKKEELIRKIAPILRRDFPRAEVIDDERAGDGIRLDMNDGMFVIRYSQNGPYVTVKFEGKTPKRYEELRAYIDGLLHRFKEVDYALHAVNADSLTKSAK